MQTPIIKKIISFKPSGGIVLMIAAALAIICANTPASVYYDLLLSVPLGITIGSFEIIKPVLLWINDGLMAVFFFYVGLELKRELLEGELSNKRNIILPAAGAVGGMVFPALIYLAFNSNDEVAIQGWAIPAATDIAFALGVLMLLGSKVPVSIKIFLTSLAIFDDIGAIIIIAIFYTSQISLTAIVIVMACLPILFLLNRKNVISYSPYLIIGAVMWAATLKSGVHATLAGVLLATFIPMRSKKDPSISPLKVLEKDLHHSVDYIVLPVFAFANAGLNLSGVGTDQLLHPVPIGIALGLFFGKQFGIFAICWLFIKLKITSLPRGMSWMSLYGTAALCGIGFTMSLFIGSLAFQNSGVDLFFDERLGIIIGSLASGIVGYFILKKSLKSPDIDQKQPK